MTHSRAAIMTATRRQFLTTVGSAMVLSLDGTVPRMLLQAAEQASSPGETVLVVVQLSGGNDGLNTVVPHTHDVYYRSRPKLAIPATEVLALNEQLGLHPACRGLHEQFQAGRLAIVQGVGYAQPNRSHFESMDIWHTCYRKDERPAEGWLGRYLDQTQAVSGGDPGGLHLGSEKQPVSLAASSVRTPSVSSLDRFRLLTGDAQAGGKAVQQLTTAARAAGGGLLDFVQTSAATALTTSQRLELAAKEYQTPVAYPETRLAQKLRLTAQLISAGLSTRIYYVELDGFDTHSLQAGAHAALLTEFSAALTAFLDDLAHQKQLERVLVLSFSEFGRRVQENASEGTDHGAAAPVFLAGGKVKGGLVGALPSLTDLEDGDLKFHTDFRRVYATILDRWLQWPSQGVLGGQFEPLDVV